MTELMNTELMETQEEITALQPQPNKGFALTSRDISVMKFIAKSRYLSTGQVKRLCFADNVNNLRTQQRLKLLHDAGLISRAMTYSDQGLKQAYAYYLTSTGAEYLRDECGQDNITIPRKNHFKHLFLQHSLGISEFFVNLHLAVQQEENLFLEQFIADFELKKRIREQHTNSLKEREIYREFIYQGKKFTLLPDALFVLADTDPETSAQDKKLFLVEIDRSTESIQKVLVERCLAYHLAYKHQAFADYSAGSDFTILIQTTNERRRNNIQSALIGVPGAELVWTTAFPLVSPESLLTGKIWIDWQGQGRAILNE